MIADMREYRKLGSTNDSRGVKQYRNLLIISCSKRKVVGRADTALQVYDGPVYRVLRKRISYMDAAQVQIFIVSAKYGFISAETVIESYERKITAERAAQLNMTILDNLQGILNSGNYRKVFINLGSTYSAAIRGIERILPPGVEIGYACGGIGQRTSQTIRWLERAISKTNGQ